MNGLESRYIPLDPEEGSWVSEAEHNLQCRGLLRTCQTDDTMLVYILGPTGSGKSGMAIELATKYYAPAAIIPLDSRTAVFGPKIAVTMPSAEEQRLVPHYNVGRQPYTGYNASSMPELIFDAQCGIAKAIEHAQLPLLVGGAVYLAEALIYDNYRTFSDKSMRQKLRHKTVKELAEYCEQHDFGLPVELDEHRLIKHIITRSDFRRHTRAPAVGTLVLGIEREQDDLADRICTRVYRMEKEGLYFEFEKLLGAPMHTRKPIPPYLASTMGYRELAQYSEGELPYKVALSRIADSHLRLATWQQRELKDKIPHIQWVRSTDEARTLIDDHMRKVWQARRHIARPVILQALRRNIDHPVTPSDF